jgi:hypothetical protein
MRLGYLACAVFLATIGISGACSSDHKGRSDSPEAVGSISMSLATTPSDVQCLELDVNSIYGTQIRRFDATPGQPLTVTVTGLPTGWVMLSQSAYNVPCDQVGPSTPLTWVSPSPVSVNLYDGVVTPVTIVLRRTAGVVVTPDFQEPPQTCAGWTCSPWSYGTGNGCDFYCGCPDPDCESSDAGVSDAFVAGDDTGTDTGTGGSVDAGGTEAGGTEAGGTPPVYSQDWQSGAGGWVDLGGQPSLLDSDPTSPAGSAVQVIDRGGSGGDYFSPAISVVGGETYCISVKIRWISGYGPFVGVLTSTSTGPTWLVGSSYTDPVAGPVSEVNASEPGWQSFNHTLTIPIGATQIQLVDELYAGTTKGGSPLAYFDDFRVSLGACGAH